MPLWVLKSPTPALPSDLLSSVSLPLPSPSSVPPPPLHALVSFVYTREYDPDSVQSYDPRSGKLTLKPDAVTGASPPPLRPCRVCLVGSVLLSEPSPAEPLLDGSDTADSVDDPRFDTAGLPPSQPSKWSFLRLLHPGTLLPAGVLFLGSSSSSPSSNPSFANVSQDFDDGVLPLLTSRLTASLSLPGDPSSAPPPRSYVELRHLFRLRVLYRRSGRAQALPPPFDPSLAAGEPLIYKYRGRAYRISPGEGGPLAQAVIEVDGTPEDEAAAEEPAPVRAAKSSQQVRRSSRNSRSSRDRDEDGVCGDDDIVDPAASDFAGTFPLSSIAKLSQSAGDRSSSRSAVCCRICREGFDDAPLSTPRGASSSLSYSSSASDAAAADLNPLLNPCACQGSMAVVHLACLQAWRFVARRGRNPAARGGLRCETCLGDYLDSIVYTGGTLDPVDGRWSTTKLGAGWTPEDAAPLIAPNDLNNNGQFGADNRDWDQPNLRDILDLHHLAGGDGGRLPINAPTILADFIASLKARVARLRGLPPPALRPVPRAPAWLALFPPHVAQALRSPPLLWRLLARLLTSPGRHFSVLLLPPILSLYCTARRFLKKRGVSRRRWSCTLCARRARWKCVRCLRSYYCSRDCQNADWHLLHRHLCFRPRRATVSGVLYAFLVLGLSFLKPLTVSARVVVPQLRAWYGRQLNSSLSDDLTTLPYVFSLVSSLFHSFISGVSRQSFSSLSDSMSSLLSFLAYLLLSHTAPFLITFLVILPLSFVCCGIIVGEFATVVKALKIPSDFGKRRLDGGIADLRDILRRRDVNNYRLRDPIAPPVADPAEVVELAAAGDGPNELEFPPAPPRLARGGNARANPHGEGGEEVFRGEGAAAGVAAEGGAAILGGGAQRRPRRAPLVAVEGGAAPNPNFDMDAPPPPPEFQRDAGRFPVAEMRVARGAAEREAMRMAAREAVREVAPANRRAADIRGRSLEVLVVAIAVLATTVGGSFVFNAFQAYSEHFIDSAAWCGGSEKECINPFLGDNSGARCLGFDTPAVRLVRFAASYIKDFQSGEGNIEGDTAFPSVAPLNSASFECVNDLVNFVSIILAAIVVLVAQFIRDSLNGGRVVDQDQAVL